jgi:hypothetical protein
MSEPEFYKLESRRRGTDKVGRDEWLAQQHREKRHCRVLCASITSVVVLLVIAAAIVGWYFTKVRKI